MVVIVTDTKRFIKFESKEDYEKQSALRFSGVHGRLSREKGFMIDNHFCWIVDTPSEFPCYYCEVLTPFSFKDDKSTLAWRIPEFSFPQ